MASVRPRVGRRRIPWHLVVFLGPAVLIYTAFMVYPLFESLRLSLFSSSGSFVGTANYAQLLTDNNFAPRFWGALQNNLVFFAIHMLVQNPIGLLLAALLSTRVLRGRAVYRTPDLRADRALGGHHRLHLEAHPQPACGASPRAASRPSAWTTCSCRGWASRGSALIVVGLMSVWQFVGIPMLLFSAALLAIPDEIIEAARVDGAGSLRIFRRIQLPLIAPTVGIVAILTFVGNFNAFDLVYSVQGGLAGPRLQHRPAGHVLLPDVLRLPAPAGQPDDGRDGGRDDVPDHPVRRGPVPVRDPAAPPDGGAVRAAR